MSVETESVVEEPTDVIDVVEAPSNPTPDITDGEDLTAKMRSFNTDEYARPRVEFKRGHVTPRKLAKNALRRTEEGFRVKLPSGAPVATPTVHAGIVVVSGGFRSREMYAFRERTGETVWAISLDDDGPSNAACEGRVCVFNTESCTIFAVDVETGEMLWSWWLGDPLMSAPTVANGLVFTSYPALGGNHGASRLRGGSWGNTPSKTPPPGMSHALAAFDLQTGELRWARWIDSDVMSAPVAVGDVLYATSFAGTVYKLDQRSGEIRQARAARATSAPIVANGELFFTRRVDGEGDQHAWEGIVLNRRGGNVVQRRRRALWIDSAAQARSGYAQQGEALDTGNGFAGGAPSTANAEVARGNIGRAQVSTLQAFQGSRILNFGGTNFLCMGNEIAATDPESGDDRWQIRIDGDLQRTGGALGTAPLAAGGFIFVATLDGAILQLEPETGVVHRRFAIGSPVRNQPVVMNGWIYVGTENGELVAIDTGNRALTGWSTWGGNSARTGVAIPVES